jgi:hypothetical protein
VLLAAREGACNAACFYLFETPILLCPWIKVASVDAAAERAAAEVRRWRSRWSSLTASPSGTPQLRTPPLTAPSRCSSSSPDHSSPLPPPDHRPVRDRRSNSDARSDVLLC